MFAFVISGCKVRLNKRGFLKKSPFNDELVCLIIILELALMSFYYLNKPSYLLKSASVISGFLISSCLIADDLVTATDESFSLNKVLVSATRLESPLNEVSRPVAVVERKDIDTMQPQSVAQLLRFESNVSISGGPRSGSQSVNIRGLEGSKVLQTVDGVRQVFESGHRPSYFLDPALLKSVEVVKGPASTLWGSGAVGGVVSQNTIEAVDIIKANQDIGGFVKASFNNNNDQQAYVSALAGRTDAIDWLLSAYFRDSNDASLGNNRNLENSAKQDHGALLKAAWQLDEDHALNFSYRESDEQGEIPSNSTTNVNGSSVFLIDRETTTNNASIAYDFDTRSMLVNGSVNAYWNHVDMQESRVSDGRGDSTDLDVFGFSVQNMSMFDGFSLFYGIDAYQEDFNAQRDGVGRPMPPKAISKVWGGFISSDIDLSEAFKLELGLRYDDFETKAKNLNTQTKDEDFSPSLALTWQANQALSFTLRHDQAFRAPSSEELYTTGTHFCMGPGFCNTFVSNPDLEAEKAANTELLTRIEFEPNSAGGRLYLDASYFENKVDNFIEQIVTGPSFFPVMDPGTTTWVNVDEASIKGFELASVYQQNDFGLSLAYGRTRGKDDKTNEDLTGIPADKITADINYAYFNKTLKLGLRVSKVDSQLRTNYSANTTGTSYESYTIGDLYASWSPAMAENLNIDLTINNITDRHYRQAWQELYSPGREIIVATKYSF